MILHSLLISAGLSSRMGKFKPLLPFNNEPIIIIITKKLLAVSSKVFIVTGYKEKELILTFEKYFQKAELKDKIVFVPNPAFEKGMFTSLQKGLDKGKECDWLLYHFADQPQLPHDFYANFVIQIDDKYDWIQPAYKEKKGHPILIRNSLFKYILGSSENSSLKELIDSWSVNKKIWSCSYKETLFDIDTPEDYNKAVGKK